MRKQIKENETKLRKPVQNPLINSQSPMNPPAMVLMFGELARPPSLFITLYLSWTRGFWDGPT